ncbi:MAG: radical SAM protein [Desulfosarcinaceae bacterium]|nr:radical SAM protein [Desulfosarcinaceae bacterium]
MRYEGPIYRPPSEAGSLLIQATVGCPHNKCSFCMIYKKGPPYRVRPVAEICADIDDAHARYGNRVRTLFFPAGNTIAMPTADLAAICRHARERFPALERITVYGSSAAIAKKGATDLATLRSAGLSRIHVGLESGDDTVLSRIKKGTTAAEQILAGQLVKAAGIELSEYVILGIGGAALSQAHAVNTAKALAAIAPDVVRLRTLVPKINTLLLHQIRKGRFQLLSPHEILREARWLLTHLDSPTRLTSDHYSNYINLAGQLPEDRARLLAQIEDALTWDESRFRPIRIGTQ